MQQTLLFLLSFYMLTMNYLKRKDNNPKYNVQAVEYSGINLN